MYVSLYNSVYHYEYIVGWVEGRKTHLRNVMEHFFFYRLIEASSDLITFSLLDTGRGGKGCRLERVRPPRLLLLRLLLLLLTAYLVELLPEQCFLAQVSEAATVLERVPPMQ